MRRLALVLSFALSAPLPAGAGDVPMTAAEFDAYVTGKTLTYSQFGSVFGIEEYLPGRKVRWKFTADDCQYGSWYEKEGLICFTYEYDPEDHCWTFWQDGEGLRALSVNDAPGSELSEVAQSSEGLNCPGPDVGV
ncbi:hypothetical protein LHP98_11040 [Rhodobacter sp. Har01]|uniref:hypothetical protein n=1 Tax=Rhodobacter sp. Har01 TaxID=2883999 RepID=UPI001D06EF6B|nr:hypothetical protein [Rhodobacter sp. Har01]MCB6178663.1 hypothetical protein [Rhodobacter sp. Har01]